MVSLSKQTHVDKQNSEVPQDSFWNLISETQVISSDVSYNRLTDVLITKTKSGLLPILYTYLLHSHSFLCYYLLDIRNSYTASYLFFLPYRERFKFTDSSKSQALLTSSWIIFFFWFIDSTCTGQGGGGRGVNTSEKLKLVFSIF